MDIRFILVVFLVKATDIVTGLKHGEIAYKVKKLSDNVLEFRVTNGLHVIHAKTSENTEDIVSCSIYQNPVKSLKLAESEGVQIERIGGKKIKLMIQKCRELRHKNRKRATTTDDGGDPFNHNMSKCLLAAESEQQSCRIAVIHSTGNSLTPFATTFQNKPFDPDFGTGSPSGAGSHFAIYPGTKWCGYENIAENMQDLGVHNETDACCRTHDHCPYYIDRFESKYHYYNAYPWTISHCDCDQHLYDCLKKVNTDTSNSVGDLFFGLLDVQCFTFQQGKYCEDKSIISKLWCSKSKTGTRAVMQKFPHKWGDSDGSAADIVG